MTALAFLMAALLALSGALKARSGLRVGIGILPGVLLELVVAIGFAAVPLVGRTPPLWVFVLGTALLVGSSLHYATVIRRLARSRESSEGGRLAAYVKYLSEPNGED